MSNFIQQYWEKQGAQHGSSYWSSWGDSYMINLEIDLIHSYLKENMSVLDVGCANGYSTFKQLEKNNFKTVVGVDFANNMIEQAKKTQNDLKIPNNMLSFQEGDIRSLNFADEIFDCTYTTRVLINLATWEEQIQGIKECLRVTKKGGLVIFSEAFWEPLTQLNGLRSIAGLEPLYEHDFNRYLKKQKIEQFLQDNHLHYEVNTFSSLFYLCSRFLRDLATPKPMGYENPFNEMFYMLEKNYSADQFGVQQAYIIHKP